MKTVNETNLNILLELADKLTKINDNSDKLKQDLLYKYELIISDIIPKNLIQLNTKDFVSENYQNSPSTTVNYNSRSNRQKKKKYKKKPRYKLRVISRKKNKNNQRLLFYGF